MMARISKHGLTRQLHIMESIRPGGALSVIALLMDEIHKNNSVENLEIQKCWMPAMDG